MPYRDDLEKARLDLLRALESGMAADIARAIEVMIDAAERMALAETIANPRPRMS